MKRAMICPDLCVSCDPCRVEVECKFKAVFREEPGDKPWVDFYRCSGCLECKKLCEFNAVTDISKPCDGKGKAGW